jgi:hypothetical protein
MRKAALSTENVIALLLSKGGNLSRFKTAHYRKGE